MKLHKGLAFHERAVKSFKDLLIVQPGGNIPFARFFDGGRFSVCGAFEGDYCIRNAKCPSSTRFHGDCVQFSPAVEERRKSVVLVFFRVGVFFKAVTDIRHEDLQRVFACQFFSQRRLPAEIPVGTSVPEG